MHFILELRVAVRRQNITHEPQETLQRQGGLHFLLCQLRHKRELSPPFQKACEYIVQTYRWSMEFKNSSNNFLYLTKLRPFLYLETRLSMRLCSPSGLTQIRSASVVSTEYLSLMNTVPRRFGRSVYIWSQLEALHPLACRDRKSVV